MALLQIVIDLSVVSETSFGNPFSAALFFFTHGGWIALLIVVLWGIWEARLVSVQNRYDASVPYILLAVDVPRENEQSPKAVEQIFAHLSGIQKKGNLIDRYIHGYTQREISLELVSIGGYIQFVIRLPAKFRDLVEAAFYAQYPNAEISEIDDYVPVMKPDFPGEYDLWGTEIAFTNKNAFPIRTYPAFEHSMTQKFLDPMASILEIMGRLRAGEQVWLQLVITPTPDESWREAGEKIIRKMIKAKGAEKGGVVSDLVSYPGQLAIGAYETVTRTIFEPTEGKKREERELPSIMQHIPPNERAVLESIGIKISKLAYLVKFRFVYFAHVSVFDTTRRPAVIGALKQFNTLDLNGFKVNKKTKTSVNYFFTKRRAAYRKRKIYWGYRYRSLRRGQKKLILNIEELASVYHFPVIDVKAPLVKKTESKKGEPPVSLPVAAPPSPAHLPAPE